MENGVGARYDEDSGVAAEPCQCISIFDMTSSSPAFELSKVARPVDGVFSEVREFLEVPRLHQGEILAL